MFKYILILFFFAAPLTAEVSNVYLGAPGQSTKFPNGYPIVRKQYSMMYDTTFKQPLWVAWSLSKSDLGQYYYSFARLTDSTLPASFYRVSNKVEYNGGIQTLHMPCFIVPAEHRSSTIEDRDATRLLSQSMPVNIGMTYGSDSCLYFAKNYNKVIFLYGGPIFTSNPPLFLNIKASQNILGIPDSCYYIYAVMDSVIPIEQIKPKNISVAAYIRWRKCSVDEIEALTGLDFFSNLPTEVQSAIESPATGIIEEEDNELKIYPSPTAGMINIDGIINTPIEIYDINGQFRLCDNKSKIDLSDLPAGGYYLRVNNKMHLIVKI